MHTYTHIHIYYIWNIYGFMYVCGGKLYSSIILWCTVIDALLDSGKDPYIQLPLVADNPNWGTLINFSNHPIGKKFENTEMFGQYPLQVNGFKDLHECLEAAMIEGEIESLHSDNSGKSGQEVSSAFSLSSYLPFSFKWPSAYLRF